MTAHNRVHPSALDVLSQPDFLSLSVNAAQRAVFSQTKDGIGLVGKTEVLDNGMAYGPIRCIGPTVGIITVHVIVISRNFFVKRIASEADWRTVVHDFYDTASAGLRTLSPQIQAEASSDEKHYFRFAYVTNLDFSNIDHSWLESERMRVQERFDAAVACVSGINLASSANRAFPFMLNSKYVASVSDPEAIRELLGSYRRYILEVGSDGRLTVKAALLAGIHSVASEANERHGSISKVSFLKSDYHQIAPDVVDELESLVGSPSTKERDLQRFFEKNPYLLCDGKEYRIYPQITFETDTGNILRPDFFLELIDSDAVWPDALIDIKRPSERLVLNQQNRPRFYAKIYEYAAQLREYGRFFDSASQRHRLVETLGIRAMRPRLVMIVGRDYDQCDYDLVNRVKNSMAPVELKTYDDILRFGRALIETQGENRNS